MVPDLFSISNSLSAKRHGKESFMMTAAMDMMQVESRINGVNEALTIAGAPFHVSPISVPKANVGEIPGFSTRTIPEDGLMHPIVYWDPKFEKLTDMDLAKHIIQSYIDGMREEVPAFSDILTHDYLLGHVLPRVLSRDSNEGLLQERSIPYALLPDTDLLATFYIPVAEVDGNVQVNRTVAEVAGVTTEELLESAAKNVLESMTVKPMLQVMHEIAGIPYDPDTDDDGLSLFVVSNDSAMYGAGVLAAGREAYCRMAEAAGTEEIFILPSSVHEVLVVADDGQFTFQDLLDMVTEINRAVVAPQEILSDNVYHFDARTGKLVHCR